MIPETPERDLPVIHVTNSDEVSILKEKILRLERELRENAGLAERWHQLAEDRLKHMDSTSHRFANFKFIIVFFNTGL